MGSTNKTANYELSQYIGSDKPTYLVDYNGDMLKIDTGMAANKAQADATDLVVSGHTTAIEGLQGTVSDQGTAITGLRTDVDGNTGSINTINSLIGNGEPTTTDKTIIGAINEVNGRVQEFGTHLIPYDIESVLASVTADGVKTWTQLLDDLFAGFAAFLAAAENNEYVKFDYLHLEGIGDFSVAYSYVFTNQSNISAEVFDLNKVYTNGTSLMVAHDISLKASGSSIKYWSNDGTTSAFGTSDSVVPTSGAILVLKGMTYKLI